MNNVYLILIFILVTSSILISTINTLRFIVEIKKERERRKRKGQLSFKYEKDVSVEEALEKITEFMEIYIFKTKRKEKDIILETRLKMIGWDKYFGDREWTPFSLFMVGVGVALGVFFSFISPMYGLFVGGFISLAPTIFFMSETKNVRFTILSQFPDIIIIINGYLKAGYTLNRAIEETIPFAGKRWSIILAKLVSDMDIMGLEYALNELKSSTDIPEVAEFCSLVKIAYNQGTVGDSFETQAERMKTIQEDIMMQMIANRRSLAIVSQAPTMLAVFVLVGAPAIKQVMEMGSMM